MAFCPNCGTPNTDQAERCTACGYELIAPKPKAKFKGTIMMSGIKAPVPAEPLASPAPSPPSLPPPAASRAPSSPSPAVLSGLNRSHQKTMLGQPPVVAPLLDTGTPPAAPSSSVPPPLPSVSPASTDANLGTMPTMQGSAPGMPLPPAPQHTPAHDSPASARTQELTASSPPDLVATNPGGSSPHPAPTRPAIEAASAGAAHGGPGGQLGAGSFGNVGAAAGLGPSFSGAPHTASTGPAGAPSRATRAGAYESTMPPAPSPNPVKVIAIGCALVLALVLVVGGALWLAFGDRLRALFGGGQGEANAAEATAWHASIAQSLTKVSELCSSDCQQAAVFFHPLKQAALLDEAKALTQPRVAKLNDPAQAQAAMLDRTDDTAIATGLGLDPQQCARVLSGGAKVVSCSVPDPGGKPSVLRIVHLSGVGSL